MGKQSGASDTCSLMDTLPELKQATGSIAAILTDDHFKLLESVGLDKFASIAKSTASKQTAHLASADVASEIQISASEEVIEFARKLCQVLDSSESVKATFVEELLKKINEEWMPLLHNLFYSSVTLLLVKKDERNRELPPLARQLSMALLQRFLPAASQLWLLFNERKVTQEFIPKSDQDWLKFSWEIICETSAETATSASRRNVDISAAISVLARLLKIYLPWNDIQTVNSRVFERNDFDVRRMPKFAELIKTGLLHGGDGAVRKQSLFILKQTVKFCTLYMQPEEEQRNNSLFIWEPKNRGAWGEVWRKFFLLYESVHETQVHIIEPLLPLLRSLVVDDCSSPVRLPLEWWEIIAKRAFAADSAAVRKRVIETILLMDAASVGRLLSESSFLLGSLLEALDITALYTNPEAPTHVSPFGLVVSNFYACILKQANGIITVRTYLEAIRERIKSATPCLFLIQALLHDDLPCSVGRDEVDLMKAFSRNAALFHNIKARRLARWQLLQVFLRLAETSRLTFDEVAAALTEFLRERAEQLTIDSREYQEVLVWLREAFGGGDYVDSNIALSVQQYFTGLQGGGDPPSVTYLQRRCDEIATMLMFTLSTSKEEDQRGGFAQSVRPLYQHLALMGEMVETLPSFVIAAMCLFGKLNETVKSVSRGQANLLANMDVSARLYEWISILENLLLKDCARWADLASVEVLLRGMRLLFGKALEEPNSLVTYLDILLYRMVDLLRLFEQHRIAQEAETFESQLQKMIVFSLMDTSFRDLETLGSFHLGFLDEGALRRVFSCELEKPPALTDSQAGEWSALVSSFAASRWSLIATMARYSRHSAEMHRLVDVSEVFKQCLDALEAAHYKSVLAIFDCMRVLVSLPPFDNGGREGDGTSADGHADEEQASSDYEISKTDLLDSFRVIKELLEEAANTPAWYYFYMEAFIDFFFQIVLLHRRDLLESDLISSILDYLLQVGSKRKNIIARLARNLHGIWSGSSGRESLVALQPYLTELLLYGPAREEMEDRLAHALTLSNHEAGDEGERCEAVENLSLGSDYLVRVHMNSILLHLKPDSSDDHSFALSVIDDLLDLSLTSGGK